MEDIEEQVLEAWKNRNTFNTNEKHVARISNAFNLSEAEILRILEEDENAR